jgi:hypothetical protein
VELSTSWSRTCAWTRIANLQATIGLRHYSVWAPHHSYLGAPPLDLCQSCRHQLKGPYAQASHAVREGVAGRPAERSKPPHKPQEKDNLGHPSKKPQEEILQWQH